MIVMLIAICSVIVIIAVAAVAGLGQAFLTTVLVFFQQPRLAHPLPKASSIAPNPKPKPYTSNATP